MNFFKTLSGRMNQKVDIFHLPIYKGLFMLAWPIVLTNLLQTLYNLTDAYFLGKLGTVEFSAPTVTFSIVFILISLATGFSHAATSMIAQYIGMKNKKMAEKSAAQVMLTLLVLSVFVMTLGYYFAPSILKLINVEGELFDKSLSYLRVMIFAIPFMFFSELFSSIFRGWGNSVITLQIMFLTVGLNIALDPLFIFALGLGVEGAALATLIARGVSVVYFLYVLLKNRTGFTVHLKDFKPDFRMIRKILSIGLPGSIGQSVTAVGFTFIMGVVTQFGAAVISIYGIGNRVLSMVTMFAVGMSLATATMAGQFVGADKPEKAEETVRKSAIITFLVVLVISTLLFFFGQYVTKFFINDPEVIDLGYLYFRLVAFSLPFFATMSVFQGALRGTGHTTLATTADMLRLWAVRIPLVMWFSELFGFYGIFYAMIISNISAMIIAYVFLKIGNWKERVVEEY
ncbi:MAG TPA: MATE family efflux transporter [Thermotogota bacterium]|nr:MATE family efflux transporter [Thermotogota bacterium]HPJ89172.1 MATE family efflux transporter [Thermotogota bacterium]HPR95665.1 MATE family efflux transporter [Thermotogota bacterium]